LVHSCLAFQTNTHTKLICKTHTNCRFSEALLQRTVRGTHEQLFAYDISSTQYYNNENEQEDNAITDNPLAVGCEVWKLLWKYIILLYKNSGLKRWKLWARCWINWRICAGIPQPKQPHNARGGAERTADHPTGCEFLFQMGLFVNSARKNLKMRGKSDESIAQVYPFDTFPPYPFDFATCLHLYTFNSGRENEIIWLGWKSALFQKGKI